MTTSPAWSCAGKGHATLTAHRQQEAVDRVLAFFGERLRA